MADISSNDMRKRTADEIRASPCDKPGVLAKRGKTAPSQLDLDAPVDPKNYMGIPFGPVPGTFYGDSLADTNSPTLAKIMKSLGIRANPH